MKSQIYQISIVVLAIISGCSGRYYKHVTTYNDEFRGNIKTIVRISLKAEERRTEVHSAKIVFEKEVQADQEQEVTKAYFVISRSSTSFRIDQKGFMKSGGQKYELRIVDPVAEFKTTSETSVTSTATVDSTGLSTSHTTDTDTSIWFDEKFIISLTPDMVSGIMDSEEVIFRFYFGPIPATFRLEGKNLESVKSVFI